MYIDTVCRPHVNFISGSNGSGKSASLQALQCCLGVKARATGRASKVDQFIKTGCSHAVAAVSLWNTGHDAFNPTVYGSIITIERRITKASSTFTLKDAAGRKVSVLVQPCRPQLCLVHSPCRLMAESGVLSRRCWCSCMCLRSAASGHRTR